MLTSLGVVEIIRSPKVKMDGASVSGHIRVISSVSLEKRIRLEGGAKIFVDNEN